MTTKPSRSTGLSNCKALADAIHVADCRRLVEIANQSFFDLVPREIRQTRSVVEARAIPSDLHALTINWKHEEYLG